MATAPSPQERRKYRRVVKQVPLKVLLEGHDCVTQTINLSATGAYCTIKQPPPLLAKVHVVLLLPPRPRTKAEASRAIECEGIVVRVEPDAAAHSRVAIFFTGIRPNDRRLIDTYVKQHMAPALKP